MTLSCKSCQRPLSRMRVGSQWPTSVQCRHCKTRHSFRYGHLFGIAFLIVAIPAAFIPLFMGPYFLETDGNVYRSGALHQFVSLGSLSIILLVLVYLQGILLTRFGTLVDHGSSARDS